jgi:hypothetical protein
MVSEFEKIVDKFFELSLKIRNGIKEKDYCTPSTDERCGYGFGSTPLEDEIKKLLEDIFKAMEKEPQNLNSKNFEKLIIAMDNCDDARQQDRGDVGFGYIDFDSTLYSIVWDLRYRLKDALDKLKNKMDMLNKVDRKLLEKNNGEYLALYGVSREESDAFKFKYTVDKLLNLSKEAKKSSKDGAEKLKEEIQKCLQDIYFTIDIDIMEDKSYHYSDSGYWPRTYNSDGTIQDGNIMKYFDEKLLDMILESLINCKVLFIKIDDGHLYDHLKIKIKEVIFALKYLLAEMEKNKISPLERADMKLLKAKDTGFKKTFYEYFIDKKPGEFC